MFSLPSQRGFGLALPRLASALLLPALFVMPLLSACTDDAGGLGVTHAVVIVDAEMVVDAMETDEGTIVRGINLDDRVDLTSGDPDGCFKADGISPEGVVGIDNQLGVAGPLLASFGGDPQALIRGSINEGTLLMLMEFEGVDDFVNDDEVTVRFFIGDGPTDVGNDGLLVPGQSFDIRPDTTRGEFTGAIVDGHMEGGSFDVVLPIAILDAEFDLPIVAAQVSLDFDAETGEVNGIVSGGVPQDVLLDDVLPGITGAGDALVEGASAIVRRLTDLRSEGSETCDMLSAALAVRSVPAFVLRDTE